MSKFIITEGKGFQIVFDNGVVLSTQFGWGNYCGFADKQQAEGNYSVVDPEDYHESSTAEIAVFMSPDDRREWLTKEVAAAAGMEDPHDDVVGRLTPDEWVEWVNACASYKAPPMKLETNITVDEWEDEFNLKE